MDRDETRGDRNSEDTDVRGATSDGETHATMGGAAAAGAVTGGVIGLAGGPVGAAIGAVGGAIVGAAAERMMHSDEQNKQTGTAETSTSYRTDTTDVTAPSSTSRSTPTSADITAEDTRSTTDR